MKKILLILMALLLVFATASCKKNADTENATESDTLESVIESDTVVTEEVTKVDDKVAEVVGSKVADDVNLIEEVGGADGLLDEVVILANMSAEEKQVYADEMAKEGIIVTYNDDGSTNIVYDDGTTVVQTPDGNFIMEGEDGVIGQIGGDWPENEYTALVPKPSEGTLLTFEITDSVFTAIYSGCDIDFASEYAELLKNAGFNINAVSDDSMYDAGVYTFSANDKNGALATVSYLSEAFIVSVNINK